VSQVDARERRCFYHHIGAVVAPHAELVVLPVHHVFIDQLIPSPGIGIRQTNVGGDWAADLQ